MLVTTALDDADADVVPRPFFWPVCVALLVADADVVPVPACVPDTVVEDDADTEAVPDLSLDSPTVPVADVELAWLAVAVLNADLYAAIGVLLVCETDAVLLAFLTAETVALDDALAMATPDVALVPVTGVDCV